MSFFTPNTDFYTSYFDKEKYILGYRISIVFTIIFGVLSGLAYFFFKDIFLSHFITFITGLFCVFYILKTKKYITLFWIYSVLGTLIMMVSMNFTPQITHFVDYIWILVVVLTAFVGISLKVGFMFLIINSISLLAFIIFSMNNHLKAIKLRDSIDIFSEVLETIVALYVFGYLLYKFIEFQSYSEKEITKTYKELKEKNEFISNQNKENIALVKEVHHRVKNNLQIIISLLRLQSNELDDKGKKPLIEATNRIMVMSLIHQKLYGNKSLSNVNLKEYLTDLSSDVKSIFLNNDNDVEIKINVNFDIGLKTIVPLGLLINELLSNSFKHAFKHNKVGLINIDITRLDDTHFEVIYKDNGIWIESKTNKSSFGLELIEIMTNQLEGDFERTKKETGTTYHFNLTDLEEE